MDDSRDLSYVSSLYGPGCVGGWTFVWLSVLCTWTINLSTSKSDEITSDAVAALLLPLVAAAHLVQQLRTYPSDQQFIFTTTDDTLLRSTASIEASLCVCEMASLLCFALTLTAGAKQMWKRLAFSLLAALVCFAAETAAYVLASRDKSERLSISRPYLVNYDLTMIVTLVIVTLLLVAFLVILAVGFLYWLKGNHSWVKQQHLESVSEVPMAVLPVLEQGATHRSQIERSVEEQMDIGAESARLSRIALVLLLVVSTATIFAALTGDRWEMQLTTTQRIQYFLPQSDYSVSDLDQAVALLAGLLSLFLSVIDAVKSWAASFSTLLRARPRTNISNQRRPSSVGAEHSRPG